MKLKEMQEILAAEKSKTGAAKARDSLLRRKYVIPFMLACIILACNQSTGINSIIAYNTDILLQSGLSDFAAHLGYVDIYHREFCSDVPRCNAGGPKGRKFLSRNRNRGNYRFADLHGSSLPPVPKTCA